MQTPHFSARAHIANEAYSLLGRLQQTEPFSVSMPMVLAAGISKAALEAITQHWATKRRALEVQVKRFIQQLESTQSASINDAVWQSRYARLKLRFNSLLDQFDIFADVVSQRAEHKTGVWIAGLDVLASDALALAGALYQTPPVMCFLERGHGAAIRKARTRLPGGDSNPVAIIQVPRERLVGSGIAASIIHEVGHQGVALLGLMPTIQQEMSKTALPPDHQKAWDLLQRWLSEILADFWAMAQLGIGATLGLMSVVGLPNYFMFRHKGDDPHPFPWIRVMISIAFGERLYPDPQWSRLRQLWLELYPVGERDAATKVLVKQIMECLPLFTALVIRHRNSNTRGRALAALFPIAQRQPETLRQMLAQLSQKDCLSPSLVFAIVGQARADGRIGHQPEKEFLTKTLNTWARKRAELTLKN